MKLFDQEPEHPLFPLPTEREVDALVASCGPEEAWRRIKGLTLERRQRIARAEADPIKYAPRPKVWRLAKRWLSPAAVKLLVMLGGNRSSKSYCAAYWLMEAALRVTRMECERNEGVTFLVVSESQESSRATAQLYVWRLLPPELKALNGRRNSVTYIHHSTKEGFSDDILVLPSGVQIQFATYNQDPDEWEGRELGLKHERSIAWWADESMPLSWYLMFRRRGRFRPGWGVWSFTPIHGITSTIKEAVGTGRIRRTRRSRVLPAQQVLVPGLRPGRVPFLQEGSDETIRVCYYHSDLTPFGSGGRSYGDLVAEVVKGKTVAFTLAVYHGFTLDIAGRAWPKYSSHVHGVAEDLLPWEGTNYLFIDPAGGRSWFFIWVRVAAGNPRRYFIYRDWPDKARHGEWAVPTTRTLSPDSRRGRDGDAGPAQRNPGWGVARYKQQILKEETIELRLNPAGCVDQRDPLRRHVANQALLEAGIEPLREWRAVTGQPEYAWSAEAVERFRALHPEPVMEPVRVRFIDPRAAGQPQAAAKGGVTLVTLFLQEQIRADGELEGPVMRVRPAFSGKDRDEGVRAVNDLLDYDETVPVIPLLNEPRLMVSNRCEQVEWVLNHYTGEGAEDDGGKDVADLLRYLSLTDDVRHVHPGGRLVTGGFKDGF